MKKITFLGPVGATFSHDAYNILASLYGAPSVTGENCAPASSNGEILKLILGHGGYGTIAMETLAEGRVAEPLESFIELLRLYGKDVPCPLSIVGAIRLKIHFCLMVRGGTPKDAISKVVAHTKGLGACRNNIAKMQVDTMTVSSNGEAARLVAESREHSTSAALGPRSAAQKYGLPILDEAFEDGEAITTFFLIAPREHLVAVGKKNRILIVYKLKHESGTLAQSLNIFRDEELNLIQIYSIYAGNSVYDFAIEIDVEEGELPALERAMNRFKSCVEDYLSFGPFEVLSK
jgi:chorismate mutase/prephenate dehydratase